MSRRRERRAPLRMWIVPRRSFEMYRLAPAVRSVIARALGAIDLLYAAGRFDEAEALDAAVEEILSEIDDAADEMDAESSDVAA